MAIIKNNILLIIDVVLLFIIFYFLEANLRLLFTIPLLILNCIILYKRKSTLKISSIYTLIIGIIATIILTLISYYSTI